MKKNVSLKEIADIYTVSAFSKLITKDTVNTELRYVHVAKKFEYGNTFFSILRGSCPNEGYVVLAKEGIDLSYIAFILNSILTAIYLTDNNLLKHVNITKKRIESITIREADDDTMYILGLSNRMVQVTYSYKKKEPGNGMYRFYYSVLSELRDGLALEFLTQPLFERLDLHIWDAWIKYLDNYDGDYKINKIVTQLLEDDNEVMNQIKKMRLVISNIGNLLEGSKS